jgi:hypothetical protein
MNHLVRFIVIVCSLANAVSIFSQASPFNYVPVRIRPLDATTIECRFAVFVTADPTTPIPLASFSEDVSESGKLITKSFMLDSARPARNLSLLVAMDLSKSNDVELHPVGDCQEGSDSCIRVYEHDV